MRNRPWVLVMFRLPCRALNRPAESRTFLRRLQKARGAGLSFEPDGLASGECGKYHQHFAGGLPGNGYLLFQETTRRAFMTASPLAPTERLAYRMAVGPHARKSPTTFPHSPDPMSHLHASYPNITLLATSAQTPPLPLSIPSMFPLPPTLPAPPSPSPSLGGL